MELDSSEMLAGLYPYLQALTKPEHDLLSEMESFGRRRRFPLVGPLVGRFLQQLAMISNARRVLELGSGFGYSAAWFLLAHPELQIVCTDMSAMNRDRALDFLGRLGCTDRVQFVKGDALTVARQIAGPFDIIFCDLDKHDYVEALATGIPMLRKHGMFVADNALWRGYAWCDPAEDVPTFRRKSTPCIREYNKFAHHHPDLLTTIVPLRDGISISVRR